MSNTSKQKGSAAERAFATAIGGERVPLSGALKGYPGDVTGILGDPRWEKFKWQCKQRRGGAGWKLLADWLKGHDGLALHRPYQGWLVVFRLETLLELLSSSDDK